MGKVKNSSKSKHSKLYPIGQLRLFNTHFLLAKNEEVNSFINNSTVVEGLGRFWVRNEDGNYFVYDQILKVIVSRHSLKENAISDMVKNYSVNNYLRNEAQTWSRF